MDNLITSQRRPGLLKPEPDDQQKLNGIDAKSDRGNQPHLSVNVQLSQLSSREIEVIKLIAQGNSNQEIGRALYITEKTVKNHITRIFRKLDIKNRTQAAILARNIPTDKQ